MSGGSGRVDGYAYLQSGFTPSVASPSVTVVLVFLQNDFTPEQEEEVRRENQWAFD
jgi:hypothetical protein